MTTKKINPFKKNKHEIMYNLVNCFIAGGLVFVGSLASGGFTKAGALVSLSAFAVAFLTKFQKYWKSQENEYTTNLFNFIQV